MSEVSRTPDRERKTLLHLIAAELDKPSLYMGGPSKSSLRKAEAVVRIVEAWEADHAS